jgi:PKD repeat protein
LDIFPLKPLNTYVMNFPLLPSKFLRFFLLLFILKGISSINVNAQACKQVDILYTEPDCYIHRSPNGSVATDPKACKEVAACEDQPYKYISSLTGALYLWTATGPTAVTYLPDNTTQFVNIVWPQPGVYTLTLTINDGAGNVSTNCITVNVKEKPVANFTFNPNSVCAGSTINFSNSSTFPSGGMAYNWNFGDITSGVNNFSNQQDPTHIFNTPGTYKVCLITSSFVTQMYDGTQGKPEAAIITCCSDTLCRDVTILPGTLQIDCIGTVCAGTTVTYTAVGCVSTTWFTPVGGTIMSSTGNQVTIQWGNGAVQGQIIAQCGGGCKTSIPVPIIPSTPVPVGNLVPCLTASSSYTLPILPGTFYTWSLKNLTTNVDYTPYISTFPDNNTAVINWASIGPNGTDNYELKVILKNDHICCTSTGTIIIKPRDTFSSFYDQTICLNGSASLTAQNTTVTPTTGTFSWAITPVAGVTPSTFTGGTFSPVFTLPGTYNANVVETTNANCNSNTPQNITITVLPATPAPSVIAGTTVVCASATYPYSMSVPAPVGYHYTWSIPATQGSFQPGSLPSFTGNSANIQWLAGGIPGGVVTVFLERDTFPTCPSANVTLTITAAAPASGITGLLNTCVDSKLFYSTTDGQPGTWSISPATQGTIVAGQGTNSVQILWHGGSGSGPWTAASVNVTTACGTTSIGIITIYPKFTFTLSQSGDICDTGSPAGAQLTASTVANLPQYLWDTGAITNPAYVTTPGLHNVTITNAGGCTFNEKILVQDPFRLATNCEVSRCSGAGLVKPLLVNVAAPGAGTFTYKWYSGTYPSGTLISSSTSGATSDTYIATADGPYYVTVQYKGCLKFIQYSVEKVCCPNVNNPIITSVVQNDCFKYTFTGTFTGVAQGPVTWDFGDGSAPEAGLSGVPKQHIYNNAGIYCVKFCVGPPTPNATSCTGNCDLTSVVIPLKASFISKLDCNGCFTAQNTSIRLGNPTFFTYLWNFGDSFGPPASNTSTLETPPVHCYTVGGPYTITLTVTYNNGAGIICSDVFTQNIVYKPLTLTINSVPVCTGIPVNFSAIPGPFVTYNYNFGDASNAFTATTTHIYNSLLVGNVVNLTVTDIYGVTCTVNSAPFNISAGNPCVIVPTFLCPGGTSTILGPVGGASYAWEEFDGTNWIPATGINIAMNYTSSVAGLFRVKVTNGVGCVCTSNAVTVTLVAKPIAKIVVSPSRKLCVPGGNITLTSLNHVAGDIANWYAGSIVLGSELPGSPNASITTFVATTTTFFLVHINQYGCEDICTITVEVNPNPTNPTITTSPLPPLCEGNVYTLTASSPPIATTWNTGASGNIITASASGSYIATVTNPITGCSSSGNVIIHRRPSAILFPHFCDDIKCACHNPALGTPFAIYAPRPLVGLFATNYNIAWFNSPSGTPIVGPPITNGGLDYTNSPTGVLSGTYYITMTDPTTGCSITSDTYKVNVENCIDCDCKNSTWGGVGYTTPAPKPADPPIRVALECGKSYSLACNTPITFQANFICGVSGCPSDVSFTLTPPTGPALTGTLPYTYTPTLTGSYTLTLIGMCNGIRCSECIIKFEVLCGPLKIDLFKFEGKQNERVIDLEWITSSETNNDYFTIEKSIDGFKFANLGTQKSKSSTAIEKIAYDFTDKNPVFGTNYYRLKAIDNLGKVTDSKIIAVDYSDNSKAKIYPNPSKTANITVDLPLGIESKVTLEWYNVAGQLINVQKYNAIKGQNKWAVDVNDLPAGKYLVKITTDNVIKQEVSTLSFEKL